MLSRPFLAIGAAAVGLGLAVLVVHHYGRVEAPAETDDSVVSEPIRVVPVAAPAPTPTPAPSSQTLTKPPAPSHPISIEHDPDEVTDTTIIRRGRRMSRGSREAPVHASWQIDIERAPGTICTATLRLDPLGKIERLTVDTFIRKGGARITGEHRWQIEAPAAGQTIERHITIERDQRHADLGLMLSAEFGAMRRGHALLIPIGDSPQTQPEREPYRPPVIETERGPRILMPSSPRPDR
ncbi:MAG: hypothetical protein ACYTF0_03800 [Planctomycetota bacterium]|jgi:hypothetical protein